MPRILIVDDNEDNRDMLSRRLQRRGFDVVIAINGVEGVAKARFDTPDLILMDMNMPDIDGLEATRMLKENSQTQLVPIIALTAHELPENRERMLAAGCVEYFTKPVQLPALVSQIEAILRTIPKSHL